MKIPLFHFAELLLFGIILTGCHSHEDEKPIESTPVNVEVKLINAGASGSDQISYSSTIEADKTIDISPLVSGTLLSVPVELGQYVHEGQLIASIDETIYRNQYNAQSAQVNLAKETYDRMLTVYNKGSIAEIRMLNAKADYEQASSAAKATYQNIAHCRIYAPQDGYVGAKNAEAGATASPGVPIVQLYDVHSVTANVPVPEGEIGKYKTGASANVKVSALGDKIFTGKVDKISVAPASAQPLYTVKVKIANKDNALKPGMSCDVIFNNTVTHTADTLTADQTLIPLEALQVDEQKQNFVFVADASGKKAVRRNVVAGDMYANGIGIKSGLQPGDKLIISGFHKITDGSPINIINN